MLNSQLNKTRNYKQLLIIGFWSGLIASFIHSPLPTRPAGRSGSIFEMLRDLGFTPQDLTFQYLDHAVNYGVLIIHTGFSLFFAMLYCIMVEIYPKINLWYGAFYGLVITAIFHWIILPIMGWTPAIWNLPFGEHFSVIIDHMAWGAVIEACRRTYYK